MTFRTIFLRGHSNAVIICFVFFATAGCRKTATSAGHESGGKHSKLDACSLLTGQEIEAVVGSPIKDTKASENSDGGFRVSQCFYTAETFSKSVSLSLTEANSGSPQKRSPKRFWKETFGRFEGKKEEQKGDEEKRKSLQEKEGEETALPPKKIEGLGDAAYWTANRVGGSLYVLKNDAFVRISVGGPDTEEVKIDKSKKLAQTALGRL
jgi:hypothetical protein